MKGFQVLPDTKMAISTRRRSPQRLDDDDLACDKQTASDSSDCGVGGLASDEMGTRKHTVLQTSKGPTIAPIGLLDLPNELLFHIFRDVAVYNLARPMLGISVRSPRSIKTFLGYGLNSQLLPIIRDVLFSELRPIVRCDEGHESYIIQHPYFDILATRPFRRLGINYPKLERSMWTERLRYLRMDISVTVGYGSSLDEKWSGVEKTMDIATSIVEHFRALIGLEIRLAAEYVYSVSLDQAARGEKAIAAELRRKLEEERGERRLKVIVKFRRFGDRDTWEEGQW